jgi:hypothetical protein
MGQPASRDKSNKCVSEATSLVGLAFRLYPLWMCWSPKGLAFGYCTARAQKIHFYPKKIHFAYVEQ